MAVLANRITQTFFKQLFVNFSFFVGLPSRGAYASNQTQIAKSKLREQRGPLQTREVLIRQLFTRPFIQLHLQFVMLSVRCLPEVVKHLAFLYSILKALYNDVDNSG